LPSAARLFRVLAVAERICLVTGAGRGIGRAVAHRLSAAGHRVALTARSGGELAATAADCPGPTLELPADVTAPGAVDELVGAVEEAWGPVGILVANAGTASSAPVHRVTDEEWQRVLDLNLTAPFRCVRRVVPGMLAVGYGRVVVVASVAAKAGDRYMAAYTASKHGVLGLVRSAAAELARSGVTVNAVCPGYVDTPMTDGSVESIVASTGRDAAEVRAILERRQPIGRLVTVDEVADAVDLCVANAAITGQGLNVDGGAVQS
jgi:NAD(P)-dependent dehydrogenase (short-subunit alcohol dehydrogenase family)